MAQEDYFESTRKYDRISKRLGHQQSQIKRGLCKSAYKQIPKGIFFEHLGSPRPVPVVGYYSECLGDEDATFFVRDRPQSLVASLEIRLKHWLEQVIEARMKPDGRWLWVVAFYDDNQREYSFEKEETAYTVGNFFLVASYNSTWLRTLTG